MVLSRLAVPVLAITCLLQTEPFHQSTVQPTATDPAKHSASVAEKRPRGEVIWRVYYPFVGCDNGTPILNVELPDKNAPTAICPGQKPPDVLPENEPTAENISPNTSYEIGTVIAVGISHQKITIAADSRTAWVPTKLSPDGKQVIDIDNISYDDCACKITQLTPTLLFAADGQTTSTNPNFPANAVFDAHKLARLAAENYQPDSELIDESLAGGRIGAIARRWAWDIDFRMHRAFAKGWAPFETLEGIFVGLQPNGETAIAIAKIKYAQPGASPGVPPVDISVRWLDPPPNDFTEIEAFGMNDVARSYYSVRSVTAQTKEENKRITAEFMGNPNRFSLRLIERLVDVTIESYTARTAATNGLLLVHGPIDSAIIKRKKAVKWIHWKKCSGVSDARGKVGRK